MRTIDESISELDKWKDAHLHNGYAWWRVTRLSGGKYEAVRKGPFGHEDSVICTTLREALHLLCEKLNPPKPRECWVVWYEYRNLDGNYFDSCTCSPQEDAAKKLASVRRANPTHYRNIRGPQRVVEEI